MSDTIIKVENVSKKYCRAIKHTMLYGATDLTRSFLGLNQSAERLRKGEFWAVDDVSFELKRGETLGVIGPNGSGKSTMLKLLNGIFMPDKGKIEINGRVGALIEVGAGFHPMLTGRENIYINGAILGMSKKEIDKKFDEIVDFADIGDFIDAPVKHYSSGMHVRLGFAIAVHAEPDILLVDEVLSVGDYSFQSKCFKKIGHLTELGTTIILVTHNMHIASRYCNSAVVLDKGKMICSESMEGSIKKYYELCSSSHGQIEKIVTKNDFFEVASVNFIPNQKLNPNESLKIEIEYLSVKTFNNVNINVGMYYGNSLVYHINNHTFDETVDMPEGRGKLIINIKDISLNYITVYLVISIFSEKGEVLFWWRNIPVSFSKINKSAGENHFVTSFEITE